MTIALTITGTTTLATISKAISARYHQLYHGRQLDLDFTVTSSCPRGRELPFRSSHARLHGVHAWMRRGLSTSLKLNRKWEITHKSNISVITSITLTLTIIFANTNTIVPAYDHEYFQRGRPPLSSEHSTTKARIGVWNGPSDEKKMGKRCYLK